MDVDGRRHRRHKFKVRFQISLAESGHCLETTRRIFISYYKKTSELKEERLYLSFKGYLALKQEDLLDLITARKKIKMYL